MRFFFSPLRLDTQGLKVLQTITTTNQCLSLDADLLEIQPFSDICDNIFRPSKLLLERSLQ